MTLNGGRQIKLYGGRHIIFTLDYYLMWHHSASVHFSPFSWFLLLDVRHIVCTHSYVNDCRCLHFVLSLFWGQIRYLLIAFKCMLIKFWYSLYLSKKNYLKLRYSYVLVWFQTHFVGTSNRDRQKYLKTKYCKIFHVLDIMPILNGQLAAGKRANSFWQLRP